MDFTRIVRLRGSAGTDSDDTLRRESGFSPLRGLASRTVRFDRGATTAQPAVSAHQRVGGQRRSRSRRCSGNRFPIDGMRSATRGQRRIVRLPGQRVSKLAIMPMSSCSRLWQWNMYRPR
jgi:hypothetical protein